MLRSSKILHSDAVFDFDSESIYLRATFAKVIFPANLGGSFSDAFAVVLGMAFVTGLSLLTVIAFAGWH